VLTTTIFVLTISGLITAATVAWIVWLHRDLPSNDRVRRFRRTRTPAPP